MSQEVTNEVRLWKDVTVDIKARPPETPSQENCNTYQMKKGKIRGVLYTCTKRANRIVNILVTFDLFK